MASVSTFTTPVSTHGPSIRRQLESSERADAIAALLREQALEPAFRDADRKPERYRHLAEETIGRLSPAAVAVARHRAIQTLLGDLVQDGFGDVRRSPAQNKDILSRAFIRAMTVCEMVLGGRLEPTYTIKHVGEDGRVVR